MDWLVNLFGVILIVAIIVWFWLLKPGQAKTQDKN